MRWLIGLVMLVLASSASAQTSLLPIPGGDVRIGLYVTNDVKEDSTRLWVGEYAQPPQYSQWWEDVKKCADAEKVNTDVYHFFEINTPSWFGVLDSNRSVMKFDGDTTIIEFRGLTFIQDKQIFLPIGRIYDPIGVKHEMLHAVLERAGRNHGHGDPGVTEAFNKCHLPETFARGS
jgi:hypothetical protein